MAAPGVGTGFGTLYISETTIHGYVNTISGATSYNIWFRKSNESATKPYTTADSNGYFFITGLTSGTEYVINYQGVNSDGAGNNMSTGKTFVAQNDRSSWTLYSSSDSWGNFSSGGEKRVDYDTDDSYLYRYAMTFSASGTMTLEIDANFYVASYISTTTSHSGGKPTSYIAYKENAGSTYTLTATVTAGTTYYLYFRGNNGKPYIGRIGLHLTAPKTTTYYVRVSYSANGGSGAPGAQTANDTDNMVPVTISSTRPRRNNYTFLGWATSSSATSVSYLSGEEYEFPS